MSHMLNIVYVYIISVGLQSESAGSQQLKHSADPVWACDVGSLQSAGGSSAAYTNPAQHHSVHHRGEPCSAVWHSHQGSLCDKGEHGEDVNCWTEKTSSYFTDTVPACVCVLSYQQDSVTIWSGKQITVYELSGTVLRNTGTMEWKKLPRFPCPSSYPSFVI